MPKGTIGTTVECRKCGGTIFKLPDNHTDSSLVTCNQCGAIVGPYRDIKDNLLGEAHTPVNVRTRTAFKRIGKKDKPLN